MKKRFALLLVLIMLLVLTACAGDAVNPTGENFKATTSAPTDGTQASTLGSTQPTTLPATEIPATTEPSTTGPAATTPPTQTTTQPTTPPAKGPTATPPTTANPYPTTPVHNSAATVPTTTTPAHTHTWADATCTIPKTCNTCGATDGSPTGHDWDEATCMTPKTCKTCNATEGNAAGHSWNAATCTIPKTCSKCGATEGSISAHSHQNGHCATCGDRQLGYGTWQIVNLEEDEDWESYFVVCRVDFENNSGKGLLSVHNFMPIEEADPVAVQEAIKYGSETMVYQGKTYIELTGLGIDCWYESAEDTVTISYGYLVDNKPYFILQKTTKDQCTIIAATDSGWHEFIEGAVLTFKE